MAGHKEVSAKVHGYVSGAFTCNLIFVGDKLGIYEGLKVLGKCTSTQLADHLGLHERWIREWLYQQVI